MRKITLSQTLVFLSIFCVIITASIATALQTLDRLPLGDFRGVTIVAAVFVLIYCFACLAFRLFLWISPLELGEIDRDTPHEYVYHVYQLFFLILFYPIMRSGLPPVPLMRVFYQALGARLGRNTYSAGIIYDPLFVTIGDNSFIGQNALIIPHVHEKHKLAHYPIAIGSNVTVGSHAVVMAGVTIGDDSLVATGAVVAKGTHIPAGELWGGVPARCIKRFDPDQSNTTEPADW